MAKQLKHRRTGMYRRLIFWILIIAFIWIVFSRLTEIQELGETLKNGRWEWVFAAAIIQILYYVLYSGVFQSAFDAVEIRYSLLHVIPLTLAALFVNVVTPTGGASGAMLVADDARRNGQSPSRAIVGLLLQTIAQLGAFAVVLISGLLYLFIKNDLHNNEIIAALLLFVIIFGFSGVLISGLLRPDLLNRLLKWVQSLGNGLATRFNRGILMAEGWAVTNAEEFSSATSAIRQHPFRLIRTLGLAMGTQLFNLLCLDLLFLAFNQDISPGPLIAGYAIGILFWIVSITPQGIGIVEGVMALVYTSQGIPAEVAATVTLAFRGMTFWIPLALGFLVLRTMKSFRPVDQPFAESGG